MAARVREVPQIYMDISVIWWSHPGSPKALVRTLRDWLEGGLVEKLLNGSDAVDALTMYM